VGTGSFKGALLSTLVIASLIVLGISLLSVGSSPVASENVLPQFPPPPYYEVIASVTSVVDGDSIFVWIENIVVELDPAGEVGENTIENVRFGGGIDAPELGEPGGLESKEFVETLIPPGTTVYLDLDNLAVGGQTGRPYRGRLERLIAVIYAVINRRWVNVNAELLRWGMEAYPGNDWDEYTSIVSEFNMYEWPPYDNSYPYVLRFPLPHDPIYIDCDAGFTPENGVVAGSGTENDPYVIEGWDISAENANGVEIKNTTAYFVIGSCYVHGGRDNGYDGIRFENVANGRIADVKSDNNYRGINFFSSNNNLIKSSTTENNTQGIRLLSSENNRIHHNNLENNTHGIRLEDSSNNTLTNNIMGNNEYYGMYLEGSDYNRIYHNSIVNNATQAHDNGSNYWDNGYQSGGNYWSDYAGVDNYWGENQNLLGSDGIGDTPYDIPMGTNQDHYPLMNPVVSRGVEVSISPGYQSVPPGVTLAYTVTVTNTGNVVDNYALGMGDNAGWGPSVSPESLTLLPSASDNATLSVTVPENAVPSTEDNIAVTATSQTDITVSDSDSCIAHVISPKAELSLTTLYQVNLDVNLYLDQGSKLVVGFYTYAGAFQAENVVWSGATPAHVVLLVNVSHPENIGVKKARLDLTTDNTENVISTISSFTVTRDTLMGRLADIYVMEWPFASPERRNILWKEITDIYLQWAVASP